MTFSKASYSELMSFTTTQVNLPLLPCQRLWDVCRGALCCNGQWLGQFQLAEYSYVFVKRCWVIRRVSCSEAQFHSFTYVARCLFRVLCGCLLFWLVLLLDIQSRYKKRSSLCSAHLCVVCAKEEIQAVHWQPRPDMRTSCEMGQCSTKSWQPFTDTGPPSTRKALVQEIIPSDITVRGNLVEHQELMRRFGTPKRDNVNSPIPAVRNRF